MPAGWQLIVFVESTLAALELISVSLGEQVASLPFDGPAAEHCGEIRAYLARLGQPIGPYDTQIAAIARAADLCVVTRNVSEFARVPGLRVENWQS